MLRSANSRRSSTSRSVVGKRRFPSQHYASSNSRPGSSARLSGPRFANDGVDVSSSARPDQDERLENMLGRRRAVQLDQSPRHEPASRSPTSTSTPSPLCKNETVLTRKGGSSSSLSLAVSPSPATRRLPTFMKAGRSLFPRRDRPPAGRRRRKLSNRDLIHSTARDPESGSAAPVRHHSNARPQFRTFRTRNVAPI